jgi:hypothetical protein
MKKSALIKMLQIRMSDFAHFPGDEESMCPSQNKKDE